MLRAAIVSVVILGFTAIAHAQAAPRRAAAVAEPVETTETYGASIFLADVAGLGLVVIGGASETDALVDAGLLVSGLVPAAIHVAHDNPGRAVLSVAIRPAFVAVGMTIGRSMATCTEDEFLCGLGETAIGGFVGWGAAALIDAGLLARVTRREVIPQMAMTRDGVRVGFATTF